jgi:hypothetical protein
MHYSSLNLESGEIITKGNLLYFGIENAWYSTYFINLMILLSENDLKTISAKMRVVLGES